MSLFNGHRPAYDNRITTGNVLTIVAILVPMLASIFAFYLNYERRLATAESAVVALVERVTDEKAEVRRRLVELEKWRYGPAAPQY